MSLHADLLEQSRHLARRERRRPKQASLRRALSSAYYALFHLLVSEATARLISVAPLRSRFARAFEHSDMKEASKSFANPQPNQLGNVTAGLQIPADLRFVASIFVELQEARHSADYDPEKRFVRFEVIDMIHDVESAFQRWHNVRSDPVARVFLAALLLRRKWNR